MNKSKVCFFSIIGRPNVGKSTLLNNILNYDIVITTSMVQTTRDAITGIYTKDNIQLIFIDTPGVNASNDELGKTLNYKAHKASKENDVILFLHQVNKKMDKFDFLALEKIKEIEKPKIAILTKIDLIDDPEIIQKNVDFFMKEGFEKVFSISYKNIKSIISLIKELEKYTYESPFFYDKDILTDKSITFISKETIRKSCILNLKEEIPHSIAIEINEFNENKDNIFIDAFIICAKESQKKIIIGKGASKIKKIGIYARKEISKQFNTKINLKLKVKVDKNWKKNSSKIKKYGY